jgi:peptide/nickel transport system permease protein
MRPLLRYLRHWRNWLGIALLTVMLGVAIATPSLVPQDNPSNPVIFKQIGRGVDAIPKPPSDKALLGTLSGQYDVLFTLLWGLRQAFTFGLSVTIITATFGVLYGAASAYLGGQANNVLMRIADAFLAVPVLAAIVFMRQILVILLEQTGVILTQFWAIPEKFSSLQQFLINADPVMWSLILLSWMPYARLVNASVLNLRKVDYVLSARALGAGHARIILRHLLPNAISPAIVLAARDVGGMVIMLATFTFIGLGGNSPWGQLLSRARNWVVGPGGNPLAYWWTYLPTTLALIIFSISWNFVGDSLNNWLNPRKLA